MVPAKINGSYKFVNGISADSANIAYIDSNFDSCNGKVVQSDPVKKKEAR